MTDNRIIKFSSKDIEEFRKISGDVNPLHIDENYARKTPFGERVVYGVLVLLHGLSFLKIEKGTFLKRISVEFTRPAFIGIPYMIYVARSNEKTINLRVDDGTISILKADLYLEKSNEPFLPLLNSEKVSLLQKAKVVKLGHIKRGDTFSGEYTTPQALSPLAGRLSIKWLTELQLLTICCSSYIVGMELPGAQALFVGMELKFPSRHPNSGILRYCSEITKVDERVEFITFQSNFNLGDIHVSSGKYRAFFRPESQDVLKTSEISIASSHKTLIGKTVFIVGGSRGIGASVAAHIANHGANVIVCYHKCSQNAVLLKKAYSDKITLLRGDASDLQWCIDAVKSISAEFKKLDGIVLCATPAIKSLRLDKNTVDRINYFIEKSVSLITIPLAAFLPFINESGGKCFVMSSQVVNQPFVDWPHYVTAKFAIEGFIKTIRLQYPAMDYYILRPPKVLTDQMNTNIGRIGAISPDAVARTIVENLTKVSSCGHLEIIEDFI